MENKYIKLSLENGILLLEYINDCSFDKKIAEECVQFVDDFLDQHTLSIIPILVKADHHNPKFSFDARKVFASEAATYRYECAAILVKNAFQRFFGEIYIQINKPKMRTQLFSNQKEAFDWLKIKEEAA